MPSHKKGDKRLLRAWASYDWANSVYFLVISSAIFPLYYGYICTDEPYLEVFGMFFKNTALISYVTALAFMFIAIWSPILSGIADYMGNKKRFMQFYCYLGSAACIGLYWFEIDNLYWGLLFYFLALVGAWSSLVFYNSYLPDIAYPEQHNKISARGFALGYIGSVLLLLINLFMVLKPEWFDITAERGEASIKAMRYSFVTVGIWWFGFSHIAFYHLPRGFKDKIYTKDIFFNGYRELKTVWKSLRNLNQLKRYLGAFFVFSMALQTVMIVAAYFGEQEISWSGQEKTMGLIISILLIQIIAIFGALLSSKLANKWGNIKTLILLNSIWVALCISAYFIYEPIEFYLVAGCVGLCMGGIQSVARSTYSQMIPETLDTTSYFSFYDVAEKVGIVIGMLMYGTIDQITGSMRNALLFFVVFFFVGAILLIRLSLKEKALAGN